MNILGISAYYHDSAACLLIDGAIIAAAQEERFSRKKNDAGFPKDSISYCISEANLELADIDYIVFYDKPFLKFDRLLETYIAFAPKGFKNFLKSLPIWLKDKLFQKNTIVKDLNKSFGNKSDWSKKLLFSGHHQSHAASAFFPSPFQEAAILTMDGVGEWATTTISLGRANEIVPYKEINFPHSLGLLYSAFTYYCGFKVNSGEYKLMGLAPYGEPKYSQLIKDHLISIQDDGSFYLEMSYFDYCTNLTMTSKKFADLFGAPPRPPESEISQREMDLAASIQLVVEEIIIKIARDIQKSLGQKNLCLAGGVALNCVANGKLLKEGIFDRIWIQPAAGDSGGAIGAAMGVYYGMFKNRRVLPTDDSMNGSLLGPSYTQEEINIRLNRERAIFNVKSEMEVIDYAANALANGVAIAWFHGRMEFGPRALGCRSILADPRSPEMQKQLNLRVKYRESFRPFAPSILRERVSEWFDVIEESPYMLFVASLKKEKQKKLLEYEEGLFGIDKLNVVRSDIPAVTHVDYSARVQTVDALRNPKYHALISKFNELTGYPVLVNTSFNVRGEPIVNTPEDAFKAWMGMDLDILIVGDAILKKCEQTINVSDILKIEYEMD